MEKPLPSTTMEHAIDRYGDPLLRLALSQLRNRADALDAVQDTFVKLLEFNGTFASEEHMQAWLLRVCINRCRDIQRSAWSRRVDELHDADLDAYGTEPSTEDAALAALERHPVWQAVDALPEEQRLAVHLHYVEEMDCGSIATLLGVAVPTVRTRLHRARIRIKSLLAGNEPPVDVKAHQAERNREAAAPHAPPAE